MMDKVCMEGNHKWGTKSCTAMGTWGVKESMKQKNDGEEIVRSIGTLSNLLSCLQLLLCGMLMFDGYKIFNAPRRLYRCEFVVSQRNRYDVFN